MTAQDYAVNFPYGATSWPYTALRPHKGEDRPCPIGTPLAINGQVIGLTGATGEVYDAQGNKGTPAAAHLHIQEHTAGNYANVRKPQNAFKPGVVIGVYPKSAGDGTFGKFIDIRSDDGWVDSYCHLSQINVQVGQRVGEEMANMVDRGGVDTVFKLALDRAPTEAEYARFVGKDWAPLLFWAYTSQEYKDRYASLVARYEFWKKAQALLGDDVTKENLEAKMKAKYGDGGNCTPDERGFLDSMYKIVTKKG